MTPQSEEYGRGDRVRHLAWRRTRDMTTHKIGYNAIKQILQCKDTYLQNGYSLSLTHKLLNIS